LRSTTPASDDRTSLVAETTGSDQRRHALAIIQMKEVGAFVFGHTVERPDRVAVANADGPAGDVVTRDIKMLGNLLTA
jgi:hypothetical protein